MQQKYPYEVHVRYTVYFGNFPAKDRWKTVLVEAKSRCEAETQAQAIVARELSGRDFTVNGALAHLIY